MDTCTQDMMIAMGTMDPLSLMHHCSSVHHHNAADVGFALDEEKLFRTIGQALSVFP